jgi:hypothetical protein
VMRADIFGDNTTGGNYPLNGFGLTQGKVLAHEIGHYLNLYHIFQGGCAGANPAGAATDACDLNGDMICDIEPANTQNIFCTSPTPNSCTANYATGTTTDDMINDYMSYADDDCMNTFTLDQAKRMWATLNLHREKLWQPANLALTGVLGPQGCVPPYLNAQIETNDAVFCVNKPIKFSNPTAGNTATSHQWQFPGANISTANTNAVVVSYATAGNYKVILRVSDGTTIRTDSLTLTVLDCKLDSSMLYMSHWYFGNYGSIDFSSGAPVQTNTALTKNSIQAETVYSGQLPYISATVSLSDSSGNLLFYSNGVSVWNNNHQKISSSPIFGISDISASSGICYVPYPEHPGKYFIAGVYPNFDQTPSGVRFVLVDLPANGVHPFQEFQHASLPTRFSQFLTVVPHCNGTDYWIITKGFGLGNPNFYSFLVTKNGIDSKQIPVISSGFAHPGFGGSGNQLKANRKGDKLILGSPHGYLNIEAGAVYDFDNRTGMVTNERKIPNVTGYNNIQSGVAFSPNGEYFYLMRSSNLATNGLPYWLFQYRISDMKYNIIDAPGFYFAASFQPGPDNQLYISTQDHFLARVSNLDKWNEVSVNGSFINMRQLNDNIRPGVSIPAFIDARQPQPTHPEFSITAINCSTYRFSNLCFDDYMATWNLGDGSAVQTGNTIVYSYAQAGEFNVSLSLSKGAGAIGSVSKKINVLTVSATISGPADICTNGSYPSQYFSPMLPGANYNWTIKNGSISGPDNLPFVDVIWSSSAQNGNIQLLITRDGCSFPVSKNVTISKGPEFTWVSKENVCDSDSSFLLAASPAGGSFSGRGVINNHFYPSLAGTGDHITTYTYFDEITCLGEIQKIIKVRRCNIPIDPGMNCDDIFNTIQVAPNPIKDVLQLRSPYILKFVQVYNSVGQKVAQGQLFNNALRLPPLAAGMYTVLVYCEKNNAYKPLRFYKMY